MVGYKSICFLFFFLKKKKRILFDRRRKKKKFVEKVFISSGGVYKAVIASLPRNPCFLVAHPPREEKRQQKKTFLIQMSHVQFWKNPDRKRQPDSGTEMFTDPSLIGIFISTFQILASCL